MSRKRPMTIEELEAEDREIARRERAYAEERMESPISRREVLDALDKVASQYAANGNETSEYIAEAFRRLRDELE